MAAGGLTGIPAYAGMTVDGIAAAGRLTGIPAYAGMTVGGIMAAGGLTRDSHLRGNDGRQYNGGRGN